jgi:hypothetical protein
MHSLRCDKMSEEMTKCHICSFYDDIGTFPVSVLR